MTTNDSARQLLLLKIGAWADAREAFHHDRTDHNRNARDVAHVAMLRAIDAHEQASKRETR